MRVETTSYGAPALQALARAVADLKGPDPMATVTVLAPNSPAATTARRHLARGTSGLTGVAGIEISTLPRFAETCAAHTLAPRRPATGPVLAAAWRRALSQDPGVFGPVAEHPATVRALSAAHHELRDLSQPALDAVAASTEIAPDLIRLHRGIVERLQSRWYDTTDLLAAAAQIVTDAHSADGPRTPVVIYLPQVLTRAEAALARALDLVGGAVVIAGLTGDPRADAGVHHSLSRLGATAGQAPTAPLARRVLNASDSDDEVRCVVRDLMQTLQTTPAHRVAVLYAGRSPYARLLHEQLDQAGIRINGPGPTPVEERGTARALTEILDLVDHDLPRADLFRALANAPISDFDGSPVRLSHWERISRDAGIVSGQDWDDRLDRYISSERAQAAHLDADPDKAWLAERHRTQAEQAQRLGAFANRLRHELAHAQTMTSWAALSRWSLDLFGTLVGHDQALQALPPGEQHAAARVIATLRGLGDLDGEDAGASLRSLRDILAGELGAAPPRVGTLGNGVLVAPMSWAIGLDLDVTYVVGLSEDSYPGRIRQDALLPERARASAPTELASYRQSLDDKHRHLLAALASAPHVVASFPRGDLRRSTHRLPSRWLLPTLRDLAGTPTLAATHWQDHPIPSPALSTSGSFAGQLLRAPHLATSQEWRTRRAAATAALDDPITTAATQMVTARASSAFTRYDGNLAHTTGLPNYAQDPTPISPTALESYADCPHAFFVRRLLGVRPLEHPEDLVVISPMDIGNLIHACMDELVRTHADSLPTHGEPWSDAHRDAITAIAHAQAQDFESRGLTGHPRLWDQERQRIVADLLDMLDDDNTWRATHGATVAASELAFGMAGEAPIEVPVPGGRILMRGAADKVDISADGTIHVTDIKTGSRRRFKAISQADPLAGATKLQLPVYAHAARRRFGHPHSPVSTAYWFVRSDPGRIGIDMTPAVEDHYSHVLGVLTQSIAGGLFPPKAPESPDFSFVQCDYCNPDGIGHADQRERWQHKRHDPHLVDLTTLIDPTATQDDA